MTNTNEYNEAVKAHDDVLNRYYRTSDRYNKGLVSDEVFDKILKLKKEADVIFDEAFNKEANRVEAEPVEIDNQLNLI